MGYKKKFNQLLELHRELLEKYKKSRRHELWEFGEGFQEDLKKQFNKEINELEHKVYRIM